MSIVSYAQNFEDVMLWRALGDIEKGLYIDIGAQDPVVDSVSLAFHELGWRGIHVEPTPHYAELLRQQRPGDKIIQAAIASKTGSLLFFEIPNTGISTADATMAAQHRQRGFDVHEISVKCITLATVFKQCQAQDIHWLKIDVEGLEEQVLRSWKAAKARPWIVVVESTLPLSQTESHEDWEALLLARQYSPVYFDGLNRYYISAAHPELKQAFAVPPNVFDGFKLNGTASSTMHHLIDARHKSESSNALEHHTRQQLSLQGEIERLTADAATLRAAQENHQTACAERERELTAAVLTANRQAEAEKNVLAQAHENLKQTLQAAHAQKEAAHAHQLQAFEGELYALQQKNAASERLLVAQADQAKDQVGELKRGITALKNQYAEAADKLRSQLDNVEKLYVQRERELSAQLVDGQQQAARENAEQARYFLDQERALHYQHAVQQGLLTGQLKTAQSAIELLLRQHAESEARHSARKDELKVEFTSAMDVQRQREQELLAQLLTNQQQAAKTNEERSRKHLEQERSLRAELARLTDYSGAQFRELNAALTDHPAREEQYATSKDDLKTKFDIALSVYLQRERQLTAHLLTNREELNHSIATAHGFRRAAEAEALAKKTKASQKILLLQEHLAREKLDLSTKIVGLEQKLDATATAAAQREQDLIDQAKAAKSLHSQQFANYLREFGEREQTQLQHHEKNQASLIRRLNASEQLRIDISIQRDAIESAFSQERADYINELQKLSSVAAMQNSVLARKKGSF